MMIKILSSKFAGALAVMAALFAGDLFRMYTKYAGKPRLALEIIDANEPELVALKRVIFSVDGENCIPKMKFESVDIVF